MRSTSTPSTSAAKKLSKKLKQALAMAEQDVITPLTSGAECFCGAYQKRWFVKNLKCPNSSVGRAAD
ncbi:hypothetical protein DXM21_14875 [Agrobacterium rosae]|nr:hypothetical protein DXM21_14875 [Agrobacterium rosae]KAA3517878.1 hypothetical protein DXM25_14925 [Agrobacterium rosae]MQB49417.1 hypothetical protein [Agrobacterium rosae]